MQSVSELKRNMAAANEDLVKSLREDVESAVLLEKVLEEVELGRMRAPVEVGMLLHFLLSLACWQRGCLALPGGKMLSDLLLSPRFAVCQPKPDGSVKVRPVDDCTRCVPMRSVSWTAHL